MLTIALRIDLSPAFIPIYSWTFPMSTWNRTPKHLYNSFSILCFYIIRIEKLRFSNFPCHLNLFMFARICPCLITPKDTIPLLIRPVYMLFGKGKSKYLILLTKRWLGSSIPPYKTLFLKGWSDCLFSIIPSKYRWNLCPWNSAINFACIDPID